jgi:Uma2 family endonuclease
MSVALTAPARPRTAVEIMALPDDGIARELIRGVLRETPMTRRSRTHSGVEARISQLLLNWLDQRPGPRGRVHSGEAAFRLIPEPETFVGIDVAYADPDLLARTDPRSAFYDGPPRLAVEILSPSDAHEDVVEKVRLYLEVGTVVWVVDPDFRTVVVYQPGREPEFVNANQELSGDPYLPGFRVPVAAIFAT